MARVRASGAPPKPSPNDWPGRRAYDLGWQRRLYDAGYAGLHWPADAGGRGATPTQHLIFLEETEKAGAPYVGANFVGLLHAGPTIAAEGTPQQRARWLPPVLRGDEVWCQGFSEPDAGSDLAALRTRATRDGDHYVVSGSKIWTSHAEVADWCELLVRTDPSAPKHRGISWLAMPMDAPGITVRPLRTLAGSAEFAEMFLDDVRVPVANRVGEENDGWRVTMVTLSFERGTAFVGEVVACRRVLGELAAQARKNGRWDDAVLRRRLGRLNAEFRALWRLTQWNVSEAMGVPLLERSRELGGRRAASPAPAARSSSCGTRTPVRNSSTPPPKCSASPALSTRTTSGPSTDCRPSRTRSPPAPPRSSTTSSPNASSACRRTGRRACGRISRRRPVTMRFQLTDDQRALRDGVRDLLAGRFDRDALRTAVDTPGHLDRALWRALGDAGFFALCLPEADGGVGLGLPEAVLVFEEAGRVLLPGPLVATHLAAGTVPGAATGERVVTAPAGELLPWRDASDVVQGDATGAVPLASVDPLTPLHKLPGPHAPRSPEAVLLTAAEQLGSAARTCELAVRYAGEREQFGQPIGAFQAVKHLCAQMLVRAELARAAVYAAAVTADPVEIAAAELLADEAAVRNARDCVQVHGGMGFTWEADVHLHLKRAWVRAGTGRTARETEEELAAAL